MGKIFRYRLYLCIIAICIIFIILLSVNYVFVINQVQLESIDKLYNLAEESKKEIMKETVDSKIKDLEIERTFIHEKIIMNYEELDKTLDKVLNSNLDIKELIKNKDYINEIFYKYTNSEAIIWDKKSQKIIYSSNYNLNKDLLNNKIKLEEYIGRYKYFLEKNIDSESKILIIGITEDDFEEYVKSTFLSKIENTKLDNGETIWIKEIVDYSGGDEYAKQILYPTHIYKSTMLYLYYKDDRGEFPYKKELEIINKFSEGFWNYYLELSS